MAPYSTHNDGDRLFSRNIPLFTLTSPRSSPFAVNDSPHCCILFYKNVLKFSSIPNISMYSFTQYAEQGHTLFCNISMPWIGQCLFFCNPLKPYYQSIIDPLFHNFLFFILFVLLEKFFSRSRQLYISSVITPVRSFYINGRHVMGR